MLAVSVAVTHVQLRSSGTLPSGSHPSVFPSTEIALASPVTRIAPGSVWPRCGPDRPWCGPAEPNRRSKGPEDRKHMPAFVAQPVFHQFEVRSAAETIWSPPRAFLKRRALDPHQIERSGQHRMRRLTIRTDAVGH